LIFSLVTLALSQSSACWLPSYGRGVGKPISTCDSGLDQDAALCYPSCQSGYSGVGPVCWQSCPSGFTDTGADCLKPSSYGRGAGYPIWSKSKCERDNSQGCEKNGLIWYPNCRPGFDNVGCCVCSPDCQDGMTDIGVSCQKKSYGRGAGTPLVCASDLEEDAALCYKSCDAEYHGIGPVCWGSCPAGYNSCGALCLKGESCAGKILTLGLKGLEAAADYAEDFDDPVGIALDTLQTVQEFTKGLDYPICKLASSGPKNSPSSQKKVPHSNDEEGLFF